MYLAPTPNHAYVLGTVVASYLVHHMYMAYGVMKARKQYHVPYPTLYANKAESKDADAFNCVQRGMQNSLENISAFHALLLCAGLRYPVAASIAGAVYLIGRIQYFRGYATGDPKGRYRGGFLHFGQMALAVMTCTFAWELFTSA